MTSTSHSAKLRFFPELDDNKLIEYLKIDDVGEYSISTPDDAKKITKIIIQQLVDMGKDLDNIIITDATAGVGGNTISFSKNFKQINAIEIDKDRFNYLIDNINLS